MDNEPHVYAELPAGYTEERDAFTEARLARFVGRIFWLHHCPNCNGWVEGLPTNREEAGLIGRNGVARLCRRCGTELGFFGFMGV